MRPMNTLASVLLVLAMVQPSNALRIQMIGNSLTDQVAYDGFQTLAQSRGYTHIWNRQMIPGTPIEFSYNNSKGGAANLPYGTPYFALQLYPWDVVTLQPTNALVSDTMYSNLFIQMTQVKSPFVQYYIYQTNPYTSDRPSGANLDAAGFESTMNRSVPSDFSAHTSTRAYWTAVTRSLRNLNRHIKPVIMIPVGDVMSEFNRRAAEGQIPGYSSAWGLYDDEAHLNDVGRYLVGCTFFATIYKDDPRGLPVPTNYGTVPAEVATQIQQSVWTVASTHALSGYDPASLQIIAHDTLPPAYDHVPYFTAIGATQSGVTFSVTSGTLPTGLTLDPATGLLSGKPMATGSFTFTISAAKTGSTTATLTTTMVVAAPPQPQILTSALDSVVVNCSYIMPIAARNGYDTLTWSVSAGSLPAGLTLAQASGSIRGIPASGVIKGIPTQQGTYNVTIQGTDGQNRTVTKQYSLKVVGRPVNGLDFEYYESDTLHSPYSYRNLQPDLVGINQDGVTATKYREREIGWGVRSHGWLKVTKTGVHTFKLGGDFISVILISGRTITNNGVDSKTGHDGSDTVTLQPGFHRFEYLWYNNTTGGWIGGADWKQPGDGAFSEIPQTSLYCDSAAATGVALHAAPVSPLMAKSAVRTYTLTGRLATQTRTTSAGVRITTQTIAGGARVGVQRMNFHSRRSYE